MNKKNILAGLVALLAVGGATAAALVQLERARLNQPAELTKERGATHLQLRSGERSPFHTARARVAEENQSILVGFPASQDDYNKSGLTSFTPETSTNVSVLYNAKYTTKSDGTKDTFPAVKIQMSYTKDPGDRRAETWVFIPVEIPVANSKLALSYEHAINYKNTVVDWEMFLTSAPDPESVVCTADTRFDYSTADQNVSTRLSNEFKGPKEAGKYYLAIHHLGTKPGSGSNSQMWFFDINLDVVGTSGPVVGANGELLDIHPTEDQFEELTIIDGNNDGVVPTYHVVTSEFTGETFDWPICYNNQGAGGDADEWLITPAVELTNPDVTYDVKIDAYVTGSFMTEAFDIYMGTEATIEGMTKVILDEPAITANTFETYQSQFGIPEAGEYYFAIHIKSAKEIGWRLILRDFKILLTDKSALIPEAPTTLSAVADPKAELKATVSLTFPTVYMNGSRIPSDTVLTAKVVSTVETKTVSGHAGESASVEIGTEDGLNVILVTVSSDNGEGTEAKTAVTCGLDAPKNPVVKSAPSADNMSVVLSWETPGIGQHGGIVDVDNLIYNLYTFYQTEDMAGWVPFQEGIKSNSVELRAPSDVQTYYDFMVEAVNSKGNSMGGSESYASVVLGRPYTLPSGDPISNRQMLAGFNIEYLSDEYQSVNWALDDPSALGSDAACADACALIAVPQAYEGGKAMVSTPKFCATGNSNIRAMFTVFCYNGMASAEVWLKAYDKEPLLLRRITAEDGNGWTPIAVDLPQEYDNCPWLYFTLDVNCPTVASYFILESYEIYQRRAKDLGMMNLQIPTYVVLGQEATFTATVMNRGYEEMAMPELSARLADGSKVALEPECVADAEFAALAPDMKVVFTGKFAVNKADYVGKNLELTVNVKGTDEDNTNNSITAPVRIGLPAVPVITDLEAVLTDDKEGIDLHWSDPYADGIVETFESYPYGDHSIFIGPWKNLDFDRKYDFTLSGLDTPDAGIPKAFQVLNEAEMGLSGALGIPSGSQFLVSMCVEEGESDNWLISPEIVGGTNVEMEVASISSAYYERFEIMYSTTDSDPDSFKSLEVFDLTESGWDHVKVALPKDAKYFAIHYCSVEGFGMFIDDIRYSPVAPEIMIDGYNLYRDDVLFKKSLKNVGYTDKDVKIGERHSYNVSILGKVGDEVFEYPLSNTVMLAATAVNEITSDDAVIGLCGSILVKGFAGESADIFDAAGRRVASVSLDGSSHVSLPAGIYLVRIASDTFKVTVR